MHLFLNWIFLKCYSWNSCPGGLDFRVNFQCSGSPLNEESCPLKFIIPRPAVQGLMQCWGPPAWELGCSTPFIPVSCSWESCFGANGFQSLMHHTATLFPVPSLWSPSLSQQTLGEPAQVELQQTLFSFSSTLTPQPTSGWKIRKWLMFSMSPSSSSCSANHPTLTCTCLVWQLCCWDVQLYFIL